MQQLKIGAFLLILAVGGVKSYSVLQINDQNPRYLAFGDVTVIINSTTWICDRILCPRDTTERCVVTKQNLPENPAIVRRENNCLSADKQSLNNFVQDENVGPNGQGSGSLTATRDGAFTSNIYGSNFHFSNMNPESERRFNESMLQLERNMQRMKEQMNQSMKNLHRTLQDAFRGWPFQTPGFRPMKFT